MKSAVKRILLAVFGRPIRCERCGVTLFRAVPYVSGGRLKVSGAEHEFVAVDFDSMNHLVFRHAAAGPCVPAPEA